MRGTVWRRMDCEPRAGASNHRGIHWHVGDGLRFQTAEQDVEAAHDSRLIRRLIALIAIVRVINTVAGRRHT